DIAGWGHNSADYLHHLIEAIKLGSADRLAYAYSGDVPIKGLLSKAYAASQRARINAGRAAVSEGERHSREKLAGQIAEGHPATFANEQTTHFACADADGTVVSVTQTLGVTDTTDRKSTRLNSSHVSISYAVFCLKKKKKKKK